MKNKLLLLFAMIFLCVLYSHAEKVTIEKAEKVARSYVRTVPQLKSRNNIQLSRTIFKELKSGNSLRASQEEAMYYIFSLNSDEGFIIISADDIAVPVLGYSDRGSYDGSNPNLSYWMDCLAQEIAYGIESDIPQSPEIKAKWEIYLDENAPALRASNAVVVDPLIQTKWDQGAPYNALCPAGTVTGCVATAMAQIMKYWNYPITGTGSHYDSSPNWTNLFADFGNTAYDWANMANTYSPSGADPNYAVATLMYHCGISVDMDYGTGGSNANIYAAIPALVNYFKYDPSITYLIRDNYSTTAWVNILKNELDESRPVYYSGQSSDGSGHVFICDGYDSGDLFHFNWGWSGNSDGYFELSALNPAALGIGGGAGGFNTDQSIAAGICPDVRVTSGVRLGLSDLYSSKTSLSDLTEIFSVGAVKITNTGPDINGSLYFGILLCQEDGTQINYTKNYYYDMSGFASGYYFASDLIFSYSLPSGLTPGTYKLYAAFSTATDMNTPVKIEGANGDRYINMVVATDNTVTLTTKSDMAPALSLVSLAPAGNLYQNKAGSFTATITNSGTGDYNSHLILELNGTEIVTDLVLIPAGTTHTIAFSPAKITLPPGTYPLTLWYDPNNNQGTPSIQLGSPVDVTVQAAPNPSSSGVPMVVAGKMHISGPVYSSGAVHVFAKTATTVDTGRIDIDNTTGALLYADSIILYSNDTSDGLIKNLNTTTANGAVQGISTVIVRKTFAAGKHTYFSLPFATKTLYKGNTSQSVGTGGRNFAAWKFNAQVRSQYLGFTNPSLVWTEIDYAAGFAKGMGYQFYHVLGGAVDFVTTVAADIRNMFASSDKSVTYTMYRTTGPNVYQEPMDAGWAFIGGVNASTFSFKQANVGGYDGGTIYYRNTTNSQSTNDQRYGAYNEFVLGSDDDSEIANVGPYTPFYIQGNMSATGASDRTFTFNSSGLVLDNVTFRSSNEEANAIKDKLYFALTSDKNNAYDRFYLNFAGNNTESYVAIEDAMKMSTNFVDRPAVWSIQDMTNIGLVVNGLPMKDDREVRMGFSVPESGDYTISLNPMRQQDIRNVILADKVTGKKVDLLQIPYSFHTGTVQGETGRFSIYINSSYTPIPAIESNGLYAYVKDNLLTVKNLSEGDRVHILDLAGRIVASGKVSGNEFSVALRQKGVYVVNVSGEKSSVLKVLNK